MGRPIPGNRRASPDGSIREEREAWRGHYRRYFKYAARALGLGFVAGFLYFMFWPAQEKKALDFVVQSLKDIRLEASPFILALTLFYHNARASVIAVAAGTVPFLFLPILDPLLNGGVLGLLVSMAKHQRLDVPRLVVTQILPHGIFELTAVLYATTVGLYLSAAMGRKARAAGSRGGPGRTPLRRLLPLAFSKSTLSGRRPPLSRARRGTSFARSSSSFCPCSWSRPSSKDSSHRFSADRRGESVLLG